jgi:hypothetical protein
MGVKLGFLSALVLLAGLAGAGTAAAYRLHTNAADQARASRAVLKLVDLPPLGNWRSERPQAGSGRPGSSSTFRCKGFDPKTSDLVTTGRATSEFLVPGLDIENEVMLLSSDRMVELDWQRSMSGALLPCLGKAFEQGAGGKVRVVSLRRLTFPAYGSHSTAYRLIFALMVSGKSMRGAADFVALSSDRVEVTFLVLGALGAPSQQKAGEATLSLIERKLAQTVAARVVAPTA